MGLPAFVQNSTDAGSSLVEIKYNQLHFAIRMAQPQPNSALLILSPSLAGATWQCWVKLTNKLQVPERSSLQISHGQNVKLLQFILRLNILHKCEAGTSLKPSSHTTGSLTCWSCHKTGPGSSYCVLQMPTWAAGPEQSPAGENTVFLQTAHTGGLQGAQAGQQQQQPPSGSSAQSTQQQQWVNRPQWPGPGEGSEQKSDVRWPHPDQCRFGGYTHLKLPHLCIFIRDYYTSGAWVIEFKACTALNNVLEANGHHCNTN